MKIVTLVNQTGKPLAINLAPVSDNSLHLPPMGRQNVLEEELEAWEVKGHLSANPPRLRVQEAPKPTVTESAPAPVDSAAPPEPAPAVEAPVEAPTAPSNPASEASPTAEEAQTDSNTAAKSKRGKNT